MAQLNFDANTVKPMEANEPVPAGWYTAYMSASEMKPTKDNSGAFLNCEFTIQAPQEFAGRKVFTRMNLQNKNPVAQEIGWRTMSAVCHAVNVIQVQDSTQLHNLPLLVKVKLRPAGMGNDNEMHEASNEVTGYKAIGSAVSAPAAPAAPMAPPAPGGWTPPAPPMAAPMAPPAPPAPMAPPMAPAAPMAAPAAPAWAAAPAPAAPVAAPAPVAPAAPMAPAATPPWAVPAAQ